MEYTEGGNIVRRGITEGSWKFRDDICGNGVENDKLSSSNILLKGVNVAPWVASVAPWVASWPKHLYTSSRLIAKVIFIVDALCLTWKDWKSDGHSRYINGPFSKYVPIQKTLILERQLIIFCLNHHVYKSRFLKYDEEAISTKKDIFRRDKITFPVNNHMIFI